MTNFPTTRLKAQTVGKPYLKSSALLIYYNSLMLRIYHYNNLVANFTL